nr:hypothetical protein [Tanacetum cinerariifolium]
MNQIYQAVDDDDEDDGEYHEALDLSDNSLKPSLETTTMSNFFPSPIHDRSLDYILILVLDIILVNLFNHYILRWFKLRCDSMESSDKLKKREGITMNDGEAFLRGVVERMNKINQDYDTIIKFSDVNAHNIQKHDVVTELFKLTREKRKEVLDTIGDIWDALVEESVTRVNSSDLVVFKSSKSVNPTFDNNMPGKVAPRDPIVQSVFIHEQPSSYVGATGGPSKVIETISTRLDNTLYGYFIGKRIAFSVVKCSVRNNWGKYGLTRIMMNFKGYFFFKFKTSKGLDDVLENGPWMIRNSPIIMKKWSMDTRLCKDDLTRILDVLQESLTMGDPLIEGTGFTIETVTIEHEWKPPQCDLCKIFGHVQDHFPKKKKNKGKSKSTNGDQLSDHPVKQTLRYEPKVTTSSPKKGTTDVGNASKSSTMLKTTITSIMNDNILVSNPYFALDEESEEEVENVYDE